MPFSRRTHLRIRQQHTGGLLIARFKPILAFLCVSVIALSLAACSSSDYKTGYSDGYAAGQDAGYAEGYRDGLSETVLSESPEDAYSSGHSDGYREGFDDACTAIIDSMDPEYREQWWNENIDLNDRLGIEY